MKKSLKKNNKGFTLVELIVVVLIMAILSVALAPQVMKWVNNARLSADAATYKSVYSAVQLAMADKDVYTEVTTGTSAGATINVTTGGITGINSTDDPKLYAELVEILGDLTLVKTKVGSYEIEIKSNGIIEGDASVPSNLS